MRTLIVSAALAAIVAIGWSGVREQPSARAPFVLELPDLGGLRVTKPKINIPTAELQTLRFLVRKPFDESIEYGRIHTAINGESAGMIQEVRSGPEGKIVVCDLASKPWFHLHAGKNVVEIRAVDDNHTEYYASFVLVANGGEPGAAGAATVERFTVASGPDREPPRICLSEPRGIASLRGQVRVAGTVEDDSGKVAAVEVNGRPVRLEPASGARMLAMEPAGNDVECKQAPGSMFFDTRALAGGRTHGLTIEARDAAGNLTRMSIPLGRPGPVVSPEFSGRKYAVVIGVSRYLYHERGLNDLVYADADARAVRDWLLSPAGGGFASDDVLYLEDEQATMDGVRGALNGFLPKAGPSDMIFFFFAGHGAPDPDAPQNLFFLMHDTRVSRMADTALSMTDLGYELKARMRTRRVVAFIDACHSAGIAEGGLQTSSGTENNLVNLYAKKLFGDQGGAVLTASDVDEPSHENSRWRHGIFTLALLDGLRGAADANGDHVVTAGELFDYVRNRVALATSFSQNPQEAPGADPQLALALVGKRAGKSSSGG